MIHNIRLAVIIIIIVSLIALILMRLVHENEKMSLMVKKPWRDAGIPYTRESMVVVSPKDISVDNDTKIYVAYNSSITKILNDVYIACRLSSYFLCRASNFKPNLKGMVNYYVFGKLLESVSDQETGMLKQNMMLDIDSVSMIMLPNNKNILSSSKYSEIYNNNCPSYGVEDLRLIYWNGYLMAIGCLPVCDKNTAVTMSLAYGCCLKRAFDSWILYDEYIFRPADLPLTFRQKNWMPFITADNRLMFITNVSPLRVYEFKSIESDIDCELSPVLTKNAYYKMPWKSHVPHERIRGGTQLVLIREWNKYIGMGHTTTKNRTYRHFFFTLSLSAPFMILECSGLMCLDQNTENCPHIQFATGLIRREDELLVSFGENDCETRIMKYKIGAVKKMLMKIK